MGNDIYNRIELDKRPIGSIIRRSGPPPLHEDAPEVERILCEHRPSDLIARSNCVYMRCDRNFCKMGIKFERGYVHQVEPLDRVERHDVRWIGILQARNSKRSIEKFAKFSEVSNEEIARRYWAGCVTDDPSFEYVTARAIVRSVDDTLSVVCPTAMGELLKQVRSYD